MRLTEAPPDSARGFFSSRLVPFLRARFGNADSWSPNLSPGLLFEVYTEQPGLRVHCSPAYFFTDRRVFGSPTSPAQNWIQPGRYMFGAVGDDVPLSSDPAEYDIPPAQEARLIL